MKYTIGKDVEAGKLYICKCGSILGNCTEITFGYGVVNTLENRIDISEIYSTYVYYDDHTIKVMIDHKMDDCWKIQLGEKSTASYSTSIYDEIYELTEDEFNMHVVLGEL